MSYVKTTDFAAKDALLSGNPSKVVKGAEIDVEFNNIAVADAASVKGPTVSVDNAVVRWDTTTGRLVQSSAVTVEDTGVITSTVATGTAPLTVASTTKVTNLNADLLDGADWANPAALGSTTPAAVNATTVTASGDVSLSGAAGTRTLSIQTNTSGNPTLSLTAAGDNSSSLSFVRGSGILRASVGGSGTKWELTDAVGLAVTGAISATGAIIGTAAGVRLPTNGPLYLNAGFTSYLQELSAGVVQIVAGSANVLQVSSTGLAVTGAISATGKLTTAGLTEDTAGNLGLGVTPSAWGSYKAVQIGYGAIASTSASNNTLLSSNTYFDGATFKYIGSDFASYMQQFSGGFIWKTAPSGTAGNAITFTQAMSLDANGNFLVRATTAGTPTAGGIELRAAVSSILIGHETGIATGNSFGEFSYGAALIGSITQSGTTAVLYNTSSDQRLKENIVDAPSASADIDAIKVRSFDWKSDGSHQTYGMVAQELNTVAPYAVHSPADPDDMMAVDYSKLVPLLVKEIQDLRARLAVLEAK